MKEQEVDCTFYDNLNSNEVIWPLNVPMIVIGPLNVPMKIFDWVVCNNSTLHSISIIMYLFSDESWQ